MSDIVERLRTALFDPYGKEAADEITRLRRQLDTAREALRKVPGALNASYSQADAEWHMHDRTAEKHAKVVREVEDEVRHALAALDGEDKADG